MRKAFAVLALAIVVFMVGCAVRVDHHPDGDHHDGHDDTHIDIR
jgi:protein involved in sex pheromone biosynthesis